MSSQFSSSRPSPLPPRHKSAAVVGKGDKEAPKDGKRALLIRAGIGVLLLLLIGSAYAIFKPDPVAQAKAQFAAVDNNQELTTAEKWQKKREMRDELSPEARKALDQERFQEFRKIENERLQTFFAKSPQQQRKEMREMIEKGEKRRKEWEAKAKQMGGGGGRGGQGGGPARAGGPNGGGAVGAAGAGQGAAGAQGAADNGKSNGRPKMTPEERQQRRDEFRLFFTPEERAQRDAYRIMMNQVRAEMGLPPRTRGGMGGFPGGGGRGRGGPPGGGVAPNPPPPAPATGS